MTKRNVFLRVIIICTLKPSYSRYVVISYISYKKTENKNIRHVKYYYKTYASMFITKFFVWHVYVNNIKINLFKLAGNRDSVNTKNIQLD